VRESLFARGAKTVRSLGRVFRTLDSFDGNNKVFIWNHQFAGK